MHIGETVLPYRPLSPLHAVIPWDGQRLLDSSEERLSSYPGLAAWWTHAEEAWNANRSSVTLSLRERLDYQRTMTQQFPIPEFRVVYTKSGMYLAAAIIKGDAIIDHKLYWGAASSLEEARYIEAILNSDVVTQRVRPLQARGEHNPRDYDKYVWQLPIPMFAPEIPQHRQLAQLAERAEGFAASLKLPTDKRFETLRRTIRESITETEEGKEIERIVTELLDSHA